MAVSPSVYLSALAILFVTLFSKVNDVAGTGPNSPPTTQTTVILFGSLGDLSKRYLWSGLYSLFNKRTEFQNERESLRIFATGRKNGETGANELFTFLPAKLCPPEAEGAVNYKSGDEYCRKATATFAELCSYQRTKTEGDYKILAKLIANELTEQKLNEKLRIIYLSVPPFAYSAIMKLVDKYLRPNQSSVKFRIVFEKPFGHNELSARNLGQEISRYFHEDQVYRVDHYLGKQTVDELMKFRIKNRQVLKSIWNDKCIQSIEIILKERNDCRGRTSFYDKYGVILDVIQNHLTEIMAILLMDVSGVDETATKINELKLQALRNISSPKSTMVLAWQYAEYYKHLTEELKSSSQDLNTSKVNQSNTPTFAAVLLNSNASGWENIPIFILSGKQLNEKSAYVKINFKDNDVSKLFGYGSFLKFDIHNAELNSPAIEIHNSLNHLQLDFSSSWTQKASDNHRVLQPENVVDAYAFLIEKIYEGDQTHFVQLDTSLESWRIWDPVQEAIKSGSIPLMYYNGIHASPEVKFDAVLKKFHWREKRTEYEEQLIDPFKMQGFDFSSVSSDKLLGSSLITGCLNTIIQNLASMIIKNIKHAASQGAMYHLALPGGSSIIPLLQNLCESRSNISVKHLHIWVVDERCVPLNDSKSNFKLLHDNLITCLQLPYYNIHPMSVDHKARVCSKQNMLQYNEEIKAWMPTMKFDMIVLGLGGDGHVASLFPGDNTALHSSDFLVMHDNGPQENISSRMSMTFKLISSANNISVLATGKRKIKIIQSLKMPASDNVIDIPVLALRQSFSKVIWYVDDVAFGLN